MEAPTPGLPIRGEDNKLITGRIIKMENPQINGNGINKDKDSIGDPAIIPTVVKSEIIKDEHSVGAAEVKLNIKSETEEVKPKSEQWYPTSTSDTLNQDSVNANIKSEESTSIDNDTDRERSSGCEEEDADDSTDENSEKDTSSVGNVSPNEKYKGRRRSSSVGSASAFAAAAATDGPLTPDEQHRKQHRKIKCNKFSNISVGELKKTGQSFIQDGPCPPNLGNSRLSRCRECRNFGDERNKKENQIYCRFFSFRRLKYSRTGLIIDDGFCDPFTEPNANDLSIWLSSQEDKPKDLGPELAKFLLYKLGDQFCELVNQEVEAKVLNEESKRKQQQQQQQCNDDDEDENSDGDEDDEESAVAAAASPSTKEEEFKIAWKRPVKDVREMCDVCETTIFNYHWVCRKCGFVVCISCFKSKLNGKKYWKESGKRQARGRDEFNWLICTNRKQHELGRMILSQIIPSNVLTQMNELVHKTREALNLPQYCCEYGRSRVVKDDQLVMEFARGTFNMQAYSNMGPPQQPAITPAICTSLLKRKPTDIEDNSSDEDEDDEDYEERQALKNLFKRSKMEDTTNTTPTAAPTEPTLLLTQDQPQLLLESNYNNNPIINASSFQEIQALSAGSHSFLNNADNANASSADLPMIISNSNPTQQQSTSTTTTRLNKLLPILINTYHETSVKYPEVPHSWLCGGKLLRLNDPSAEGNYGLFQEVWKRGQPVIVSNVSKRLNQWLWNPQSFSDDFGALKNDLINCVTGKLVCNQQMKKFWDGFECIGKRLRDEKGTPMLLKLKDWPPGDDFAKILPSRFQDLMGALPLREYTKRNGRLNLAARLPIDFVRPDLGPKMYIAYGSGTHLDKGTTNLHLDISDAVNLMVYVGVPDEDIEEHNAAIHKAILESDCDLNMSERVNSKNELPGALWHIYNARDADKIRDLINKVFLERGIPPRPNHDPIHDQCCYLDKELRGRLKDEYNVVGYPIIQCMGDAVFIPAGAPHQVRNLQNCIKIAEDFVSPENVSHCFHLTEEFRDLTDTHTNHEDKLQIKNIIYHAVKDAVSLVYRTGNN